MKPIHFLLPLGSLALVGGTYAQLAGYWTFDGVPTDASGNGLNGTLNNGASYSATVPGAIGAGMSLALDGVDDYFSVPGPASNLDTIWSMSAWVNVSDNSTNSFFSTRRPADTTFDAKFQQGGTAGAKIHGDIGSGGGWIDTSADANLAYNTGQWYHVAYNVTANGYDIYIDGTQVRRESFTANLPRIWGPSHDINIGRYVAGTEQMNGLIDDVAVYTQNLTPTQVAGLASGSITPADVGGNFANPSFEIDSFSAWPGYASSGTNGPVTDWAGSRSDRVGVQDYTNNLPAGIPFTAGTGGPADGDKVGFVQAAGGGPTDFGTRITGLTPGEEYRLTYQVNARGGYGRPNVTSVVDMTNAVSFDVNSKNGDWRTISQVFTASSSEVDLGLRVLGTGGGSADSTLLLDNFQVTPGSTSWTMAPWTGDADLLTDGGPGGLVYGYNLGSGSPVNLAGVTLPGVAGSNPSNADFSTTGWTNGPITDGNNVGGVMADQFVYGGGTGPVQSLTLNNLTPGTWYYLDLYSVSWNDPNYPERASTFDFNGDMLTIAEEMFGTDNGINVGYRFYADAATATFNVSATSNASWHLYGFTLSIPEPSRALLLAMGAGLLLVRRRR